jgi:hypothetical protein
LNPTAAASKTGGAMKLPRSVLVRHAMAQLIAALLALPIGAADNRDESKVGDYTLPDPLVMEDGEPVRDPETWFERRRPEVLKLYQDHIHGRSPSRPAEMWFDVWDVDKQALGGKAVRKQVTVYFTARKDGPRMNILMYTPANATGPVPLFLCLHFSGNHKVTADPDVKITEVWDRNNNSVSIPVGDARGTSKSWKIEETLARGYGIATINYCDIEPDLKDGSGGAHGVRSLFFDEGQSEPAPDEWGAIGAWAWGLSRALDYIETDKDVDARRVIALGQSRLGKTVLWAGAQDTRFAMVIASCSGEMGAALARRDFGETVDSMIRSFPYQFCRNFQKFSGRVKEMPVDSHLLLSLIAPRPLYLSTGSEDLWSDPRGEFLAALAAGPVYELLGRRGLDTAEMPPLDTAVMQDIGFSCHTGKHDIIAADWDRFLDFADKHLKR